MRMKRSPMEERGLEELRAQYEEVGDEVKGAREWVKDAARGIGGGWNTRGKAYRDRYDDIFGKGTPNERSIQG